MSVVAKRLDGSRCHLIGRYRPRPRPHCVRWGPSCQLTPPPKTGGTSRPHLSPHVLWPNGCMDQDATCYGGRHRPRRHCVRCGPSSPSPKSGQIPLPNTHVFCSLTAGWIKVALGMEVGLGPGHIVLGGDPAPLPKKAAEPLIFRPIFIVAKQLDASRCHLVWR